jgi:hypothetical protein
VRRGSLKAKPIGSTKFEDHMDYGDSWITVTGITVTDYGDSALILRITDYCDSALILRLESKAFAMPRQVS